jgi:hypothetical protein
LALRQAASTGSLHGMLRFVTLFLMGFVVDGDFNYIIRDARLICVGVYKPEAESGSP